MSLAAIKPIAPDGSGVMRVPRSHDDQWQAHLSCHFQPGPDKTIVRRRHIGPLSMQRPFYPEGDTAHVYILHPPGGVVAGDTLRVSVKADAKSHALVSTPGATKFYRSENGIASVSQTIECDGSSVEWLPQENIFFNGCCAKLNSNIVVSNDAKLAWWEINCFGRAKGDAPFVEGSVENTVQVMSGNTLLLRDRLVVNDQHGLNMSCGMRNNSVAGTFILTPMHEDTLDIARRLTTLEDGFSSTYIDGLLLIRYLGNNSETAKNGFIRVWASLRLALNRKPSQLPRIWAT